MTCGGMLIKNLVSQKHPLRLTTKESLSKTCGRGNTGLIDYIRILWTLRSDDGDGNENVINATGFKQNKNFARASHFFVHFFAVFARLPRENAVSYFIEDVNKQRRNFLSFLTWIRLLGIQLQESSRTFDKVNEME